MSDNSSMRGLAPACVCEFIGTAALVFFGVLSIVIGAPELAPGSSSLVTVALAHGLALAVFITAGAYISGGQFNPAVSIALVIAGKQTPVKAGFFIFTQLLAAACAAGVIQMVIGPEIANGASVRLGATIGKFTDSGNIPAVFLIEAVMTFALMFAVIAATVDDRAPRLGGFVIGLSVTMCILAGGPLTGASMNPARTFGPAMCGNHWEMHWVYWLAPITGAGIAAIIWRVFWKQK